MAKIVAALNLKILPRDLRSKDTRNLLFLIFSQWLSLSTCVTQSVIDVVPAPFLAQRTRIPKILYPDLYETNIEPRNKLEEDLFSSNSAPHACVTAYVSKMFAVSSKDLPENKKKPVTAEEMRAKARAAREARAAAEAAAKSGEHTVQRLLTPLSYPPPSPLSDLELVKEDSAEDAEVVLGFARLYSGTLRTGTTVYGLLPKYNAALEPGHPANVKHLVTVTVEGLYIMMGRELVPVDFVRAGNIFAVKGLEGKVWRNATLCSPDENGISYSPTEDRSCLINLGSVNRAVGVAGHSFLAVSDVYNRLRRLCVLLWSRSSQPICRSSLTV